MHSGVLVSVIRHFNFFNFMLIVEIRFALFELNLLSSFIFLLI